MKALILSALSSALAWLTILRAVGPWPRERRPRGIRWAFCGTAGFVLYTAAVHRFSLIDRLLFGTDEVGVLLSGIRLHLLPLFNLGDSLRENFFKWLVAPTHGLGDSVFFYGLTALYRLLHIPLTEANLFAGGAVLSMGTLVLTFLLAHRLFGPGVGLAAMGLMAWHPMLIEQATAGYQMNFILFLEVACFYGYYRHLVHHRWRDSLLMAGLMGLMGASELLYLALFLALFHLALRGPGMLGLRDRKNLLVWSGFALAMILNLVPALFVAGRLDMTLLGHALFFKRAQQGHIFPDYGPGMFWDSFAGVLPMVLRPEWWVCALIILGFGIRSRAAGVFAALLLSVGAMAYTLRFQHFYNMVPFLVPLVLLLAAAGVRLVSPALESGGGPRARLELAAVVCVAALFLRVAPWLIRSERPIAQRYHIHEAPEAFRGLKAVGYALRTLGRPDMRVYLISRSIEALAPMEYYTGLSASGGDGLPTHLFFMSDLSGRYHPDEIARRSGFQEFDAYVEFVEDRFRGKAELLEQLRARGVAEAFQLYHGERLIARVLAPAAAAPPQVRRLRLEEAERAFDRTYARWGRLFTDRHAGAFYYFGMAY